MQWFERWSTSKVILLGQARNCSSCIECRAGIRLHLEIWWLQIHPSIGTKAAQAISTTVQGRTRATAGIVTLQYAAKVGRSQMPWFCPSTGSGIAKAGIAWGLFMFVLDSSN